MGKYSCMKHACFKQASVGGRRVATSAAGPPQVSSCEAGISPEGSALGGMVDTAGGVAPIPPRPPDGGSSLEVPSLPPEWEVDEVDVGPAFLEEDDGPGCLAEWFGPGGGLG